RPPATLDESRRLQAAHERGERREVEAQPRRECAEPRRRVLPKGEHDEVLGMREAERLEHRSVEADHFAARHGEREADLAIELERIDGLFAHESKGIGYT